MPSFFRHSLKRAPRLRHCVSAMLLLAFVVTAAGIPLPAGNRIQKTNEQFPCATSNCGCQSVEQCWLSCCCHTFAERLAWARKRGVRPPEFAIAQARAAGFDTSWLTTSGEVKLACHSESCCDDDHAPAARSCCEQEPNTAPIKVVHSCCSATKNTQPDRTVIAWQAHKCGGHSMNWLAAVPTLINVQVDFTFEASPSTWLARTISDRAFGTSELPTVPPPECA